jgi:hypothetical protein
MNARKLLDWRKLLIYSHRWMGIAGGLLFVTWFFSGIMMMYWGMPSLREAERLSHLAPIELSNARIEPMDAARAAKIKPATLRIGMYYDGRPVYRFQNNIAVYADSGELIEGRSAAQAMDLVRAFAPESASTIRYDMLLTDSDQWTLFEGPYSQMPLHRIDVGDEADTVYYISAKTGEPVQKTTRVTRFWGFLSAVLHYVYIPQLKRQRNLWDAFIVWGSFAGCLMCISGLATGIWRYSVTARFRRKNETSSRTPYAGWMKWHHYAGLIFGLVSCTWILSGGLSINPYGWFSSTSPTAVQRRAVTGGEVDLKPLTLSDLRKGMAAIRTSFQPKEADVFQFRGELFLTADNPPAYDPAEPRRTASEYRMVSLSHPELGTFTEFERGRMMDIAREAMPGTAIADAAWLDTYDNYYRKNRDSEKILPVLRVRYDDPASTWLYFDPHHGNIALKHDRVTRARRWLYNGLHSFDFPFIYERRILRDTVMIVLCLGGLALSITTLLPMLRRLKRHAARLFRHPAPAKL